MVSKVSLSSVSGQQKVRLRRVWRGGFVGPNPNEHSIFFFKIFLLFWHGSFLKSLLNFVTISLLFYVLVFWSQGIWDPSVLMRDWTHTLCTRCIGRWSLNHWTAGKFQVNILNLKLGPHFLYGFCVVFSGCSFHSPIQFPSFYKLRLKGLGLETGPNEWGFDGKPWLLILWNILPW